MDALSLGCEGVLRFDLTRGFVALVDADRFEQTLTYNWRDGQSASFVPSSLSWCASQSKCRWYACAFVKIDGVRRGLKLQRLITEAIAAMLVDHISGDTMDNRWRNLRTCEPWQNCANRIKRSDGASEYKGVRLAGTKFVASVKLHGQRIHIGTFETAELAARAYDAKAAELFGEFCRLNFPLEARA